MNSMGVFHDINIKKSTDLMSAFDRVLFQTSDLVDKMDNYQMDPNNIKRKKYLNKNLKNDKSYNPYSSQSKVYEENLVDEIDRMLNPSHQNEVDELEGMMNYLRNRELGNKKSNHEEKVKYGYGNKYNNFNSKGYSYRNNQFSNNRKNHVGNYKSSRIGGNHLIHASKFVLNNNNKKRGYKKNNPY